MSGGHVFHSAIINLSCLKTRVQPKLVSQVEFSKRRRNSSASPLFYTVEIVSSPTHSQMYPITPPCYAYQGAWCVRVSTLPR